MSPLPLPLAFIAACALLTGILLMSSFWGVIGLAALVFGTGAMVSIAETRQQRRRLDRQVA